MSSFQHPRKAGAMEYIVAKNKTNRIIAYNFCPEGESLHQPIMGRLFRILKVNTIVRSSP